MGYEQGLKGENHFQSMMNKLGISCIFEDDWFDFYVNKNIKVEVKSTKFSVRNGHKKYRTGRFCFPDEENRKKQFNENIWICFVLRHIDEQHIIIGFTKARNLGKKKYVTFQDLHRMKPYTLEDWVKIINQTH